MRVSAKVDYALRARIELAAAQNGSDEPRPVKAEALARAQNIPLKFLENILQGLRDVWIALRASLRRVLEDVTLADLAGGTVPPHVAELTADPGAWEKR